MKKVDFPIGQKVRGYGLLNEYGEFDFIPEQTGSRQGQKKVVKTTECYTLTSSRHHILVSVRLPKCNGMELIKHLMRITQNLIDDFRSYEF